MATHEEIKAQADKQRAGFMANTIQLDQGQLVRQIETLGECKVEDESRAGQAVTQRCIDFALAVGRFKFPDTFDAAMREHFHGKAAEYDPTCALCETGEEPGHEH